MVDLGCLGVKSAFGSLFNTRREYRELRASITSQQKMAKADIDLVAKIIREAVAYAKELGFRPDPDFRDAMPVLGNADPDACDVQIPLGGKDGKPFFVAGPYDNVDQIMSKLTRKLGPDGFHFVFPLGASPSSKPTTNISPPATATGGSTAPNSAMSPPSTNRNVATPPRASEVTFALRAEALRTPLTRPF